MPATFLDDEKTGGVTFLDESPQSSAPLKTTPERANGAVSNEEIRAPSEADKADLGRIKLSSIIDKAFTPHDPIEHPLLSPEVAQFAAEQAGKPARAVATELEKITGKPYKAAERGVEGAIAESVGGFSLENLAQLPQFLIPGVAELYASNQVLKLPEQYGHVKEIVNKHGVFSEEGMKAITEAGIQDVLAFLPIAGRAKAKPKLQEMLSPVTRDIRARLKESEVIPSAEEIPIQTQKVEAPTAQTEIQPSGKPVTNAGQPTSSGGTPLAVPEAVGREALAEPAPAVTQIENVPTVETPLANIKLSKDVPQFKEGANPETGVVPDEQLAGKYTRLGTGAVTLWERTNGDLEVVSGRHRLDLAKRSGEETIPSQIVKESEGFNREKAITFDAEANIRDGQGSVGDYANYFRNSKITPEEASSRGLLARDKGRKGYAIGRNASDDLYALYRAGKINETRAAAIAQSADSPELQGVGIRAANEGASPGEIAGRIEAAKNAATSEAPARQSDFFSDTSLDDTWKAQGKYVAARRKEFQDIIATRKAIVNRYEAATATGSIKAERARAETELADAQNQLQRWQNWASDTELRQEVETLGKTPAAIDTPKLQPGETQGTLTEGATKTPEQLASEQADADAEKLRLQREQDVRVGAAKPLTAGEDVRPEKDMFAPEVQGDIFDQPEAFSDFEEHKPESKVTEEGPASAILGIVPQPSEFVKQDVARVIGGGMKAVRQIKALLTPANVSEVSGFTARIIRENAAELARKKEMAATSLKDAAQILRRNDKATNLDIIDRLETGKPLGNAGLDAYKTARESAYAERIKQVQSVNPSALQNLIEDYFPHIWTRESIDRVAGNIANVSADNPWARIFGKRPLEGSKSFLKQRSIPTTADGIAIGLEPVTTNPVALDLLKMHEMDRYVMGQQIIQEMKDRGLAKFVAAGEKADVGYTQINDKIARVLGPKEWQIVNQAGEQMPGQKLLGHYYAPDDAARVINNYLSPGLRGIAVYDAFRFVGNAMNQVQLGISLYHATFTSIDAATSTLSLGIEQIARSGGSPKELAIATGNIAKAFAEAPFGGALIENLWRGNKFLREYSKPGSTNTELARIVDAAVAGGSRVKMDTFYNTGAVNSFFDALKSGNYSGAVLRAPFALIQTAAKPLMEFAVPRMKLGIISQNLEYELRRLPKEATRDDVRKIAARVVDSVDNRMGQLIYDNLFWNKALKDGLMGSVRSVGWNLGDIREIGGGLLDTVTAPKRAYESLTKGSKIGDNPVVTKRMTYVVALPLMVGVLGSMYQYLKTGQGPQDLTDVYMPRTGRMKADGTPERVMLPTYMKDIAPLALSAAREGVGGLVRRGYSMALNKLHPAITTIGQMLHNQDYYGNQIRNSDDDLVTSIQKEANFVVKNFRPFSIQGVSQREGGIKEKAQAVVVIMPAPRELTDTPAMRLIHNINISKRPAGGYSSAEQQKREDKRSAQQGKDLRPELFKRLSNEDKARVMEVATPEEREIFQSYKHDSTSRKPFSIRKRKTR